MKNLNLLTQQIKVFLQKLIWDNSRIKLKFKSSCLKQKHKAGYTPKNVVNVLSMN